MNIHFKGYVSYFQYNFYEAKRQWNKIKIALLGFRNYKNVSFDPDGQDGNGMCPLCFGETAKD